MYKSVQGSQHDDEDDSGETLANNISGTTKLVEMSNVLGVRLSARIIQQIKTKIWLLKVTMVKSKRSGGKRSGNLVDIPHGNLTYITVSWNLTR